MKRGFRLSKFFEMYFRNKNYMKNDYSSTISKRDIVDEIIYFKNEFNMYNFWKDLRGGYVLLGFENGIPLFISKHYEDEKLNQKVIKIMEQEGLTVFKMPQFNKRLWFQNEEEAISSESFYEFWDTDVLGADKKYLLGGLFDKKRELGGWKIEILLILFSSIIIATVLAIIPLILRMIFK